MESSDYETSEFTENESSDFTENEDIVVMTGKSENAIIKLTDNKDLSPRDNFKSKFEDYPLSTDDEMETKPKMTDEERQKLATKLDEELDTFIAGLEKRSYTEGWPEDKWQEEMEKHPFFMTKPLNPDDQLSPLMQGLQDLKYSETDNTPEELALTYKEDGNFNFKCKKYRYAIVSYTEGLRQKCSNPDLNAQLYNNRSASHFFLKNYRSCVNDCLNALKIKPDYTKTAMRAARCYLHLEEYDKCSRLCETILSKDPSNNEIATLKTNAATKQKILDRNVRKQSYLDKKEKEEDTKLLAMIRERGIRLLGEEMDIKSISQLEPSFPEVVKAPVHVVDGRLIWPVLFLYPEYKTSDFVQEFHEDALFSEMLIEMFTELPEWDKDKKYTPERINIYYEDTNGRPHKVVTESTLGRVISRDNYRVDQGTPAFIIFSKNSEAELEFLRL